MRSFREWLQNEELSDTVVLDKIQQYLANIEKSGYRLLAHQTSDDQALKIIKNNDFSDHGVEGTALFVNSEAIRRTIENMHAYHIGNKISGGVIHKGSNAVLVMVIPKSLHVKGTRDLDDHLIDLFQSKKIPTFGIPNQYIVGFWQWEGKFFGNGKFNPRGML